MKPGVLGADPWVIEASTDGVRRNGLAPLVLHHVCARTVEHSGCACGKAGGVLAGFDARASRFIAAQLHARIVDEATEQAHGIRPTTDAGNDRIRQTTLGFENLDASLTADDLVKGPHDLREWSRASHGAEHVVGLLDGRDPVAHRLIDRVLKSTAPSRDGDHLGAEELHSSNVERLPPGVLLAHVDRAFEAKQCGGSCRRDSVLACASFGNETLLAHSLGEKGLTKHVVDLVRAGVIEILALEIDRCAPAVLAESASERQRIRTARVRALELVKAMEERLIGHSGTELTIELVKCGGERLRNEPASVLPVVPGCTGGLEHDRHGSTPSVS